MERKDTLFKKGTEVFFFVALSANAAPKPWIPAKRHSCLIIVSEKKQKGTGTVNQLLNFEHPIYVIKTKYSNDIEY